MKMSGVLSVLKFSNGQLLTIKMAQGVYILSVRLHMLDPVQITLI